MAELNQRMSSMGINDSVHAGGQAPPKQAYIPPHMRASIGRAPPAAAASGPAPTPAPVNGVQGSRWANGRYVSKHLPPFVCIFVSFIVGVEPRCSFTSRG